MDKIIMFLNSFNVLILPLIKDVFFFFCSYSLRLFILNALIISLIFYYTGKFYKGDNISYVSLILHYFNHFLFVFVCLRFLGIHRRD